MLLHKYLHINKVKFNARFGLHLNTELLIQSFTNPISQFLWKFGPDSSVRPQGFFYHAAVTALRPISQYRNRKYRNRNRKKIAAASNSCGHAAAWP